MRCFNIRKGIALYDKNDNKYSLLYANFELNGNGSTAFSINIEKKYFVAVDKKKDIYKEASDIMYYSVYDENEYCHIGGYEKYKGLTIEEINKGEISNKKER